MLETINCQMRANDLELFFYFTPFITENEELRRRQIYLIKYFYLLYISLFLYPLCCKQPLTLQGRSGAGEDSL